MGVSIGAYRISVGDLREGNYLGYPDVDGRIVLELIFKKWDGEAWTGLHWLRIRTDDGRL
jgi:hypothetical protein